MGKRGRGMGSRSLRILMAMTVLPLSPASGAKPDVLLYATANHQPEWIHSAPKPDQTYLYFVGSSANGKSLPEVRQLAVEDAASQIADFLGIKVSTRLISKRTEVSNELIDDMRRYGIANLQGTLVREVYFEEWRPYGKRDSYFKSWVLVAYPKAEIQQERNRQKALSGSYQTEVDGIVTQVGTAAKEKGLMTLHVGGFKEIANDRRYSFSRVLENDLQTGLIKGGIEDAGSESQGYLTGEYKQQGGIVDINVRLVVVEKNTSVFAVTSSIPMESLQPEWLSIEIPPQESFFAFLQKPEVANLAQTGALEIISHPSGAQIFLEGENKGQTNLTLHEVPSGTVAVTLVLDNYESFSEVVQIKSGETAHVDATLKRKMGGLSIQSMPSNAEVYLDNKLAGKTALEFEKLPAGSYHLTLKMRNYRDQSQEVTVEFKKITPVSVHLTEEDGGLFVITDPPGASVFLDDTKIGTTQSNTGIKRDGIQSGRHILRVEKGGYAIEEEDVEIHAFKVTSVPFNLRRVETGRLEIISQDVGAQVEVDGLSHNVGITTYGRVVVDDLADGKHTVVISKPGYIVRKTRVKIRAGQTKTMRIALKSTEYTQEIQRRFKSAFQSLLLPGLGQYQNGDQNKGLWITTSWLLGGLFAVGFHIAATKNRNDADGLDANVPIYGPSVHNDAEKLRDEANTDDKAAVGFAILTAGIWAYAVGDAFIVENRSSQNAGGWYITPDIQQARLDAGYRWRF